MSINKATIFVLLNVIILSPKVSTKKHKSWSIRFQSYFFPIGFTTAIRKFYYYLVTVVEIFTEIKTKGTMILSHAIVSSKDYLFTAYLPSFSLSSISWRSETRPSNYIIIKTLWFNYIRILYFICHRIVD